MNFKLNFLKPFLTLLGVWALCVGLSGCGGGAEATSTGNQVPTANPGPSQNVVVGTLVSMDGSASKDADGGSLTFKWALVGKPLGSAATLTNPTYPNPKFTADLAGNYVVSLIVNDGKADSSLASVSVTATVANAVPVANAGVNQNVVVGSTATLDATASSDANNDSLSYKWVLQSKPANSNATLSSATSVKPTFNADLAGTYVATLVVSDGKSNSDLSVVSILASASNLAPVANLGTNQSVVLGSKVTVNGSASSDPNGDLLSYRWSLLYKPVGSSASLSSASTVTSSFTADLTGTYLVGLTVNDGKLDSLPSVITVTAAKANTAPVANAGINQIVTVTKPVTLDGSGSTDADQDSLNFTWTLISKPANSTAVLSSPSSSKPSFTPDLVGTYVASLIVNDGKESSPTVVVTVTASAANAAPVANAGAARTVTRANGTVTVALNGSGSSDSNGDTLTYKWTIGYQPLTSKITLSSTTAVSPTFSASVAGLYVFTLVVNDGKVDSAVSTVDITVN